MSVESVAREFVLNMNNVEKSKPLYTADSMVSGGVLPQPLPMSVSQGIVLGLTGGMPDMHWSIDSVSVAGDVATVKSHWGGTHTATLSLPMPGMPTVPATGKKVWVADEYLITVKDGKVMHMQVVSGPSDGIPGALAQMGVNLPPM